MFILKNNLEIKKNLIIKKIYKLKLVSLMNLLISKKIDTYTLVFLKAIIVKKDT